MQCIWSSGVPRIFFQGGCSKVSLLTLLKRKVAQLPEKLMSGGGGRWEAHTSELHPPCVTPYPLSVLKKKHLHYVLLPC